ncbi:MAG: lipocalin family protein [Elusimicrobiota bacterium]
MLRTIRLILALSILTVPTLAVSATVKPLETVPSLELSRYLGLWYEIAKYPNSFQKNLYAATAEYTLLPNGKIKVVNRANKGSIAGKPSSITGTAWIPNKDIPTKLKVTFFWPFAGDYWVIDLGKDYEYAVVSEPKRRFLWILSRTPKMDELKYTEILNKLTTIGFDLNKIEKTEHPEK